MEGEEAGLDVDGVGVRGQTWEVEVTKVSGWRHEQVDPCLAMYITGLL